jgi:hypothetical protein
MMCRSLTSSRSWSKSLAAAGFAGPIALAEGLPDSSDRSTTFPLRPLVIADAAFWLVGC